MADLELGVLAEDDNDCNVMRVLIRRILQEERGIEPRAWRLQTRAGKGCARLRLKAERWLAELAANGCKAAIVMHDLDLDPLNHEQNDLAELQRQLSAVPVPRGLMRHICIPVEEIEAWFFSSESALERACGKPQKAHPSPHLIRRPKEKLVDMSRGANKRPRYSENDAHKVAEALDLIECSRRCVAFGALKQFLLGLVP